MAFIYDLTDTWNAGGTTFSAIKMNVTDTASAAASKLITLQVGGVERFGVDKAGAVAFGSAVRVAGGSTGAPAFSFTADTNTGMWSPSADTVAVSTGGAERVRVDASGNLLVGTTTTIYGTSGRGLIEVNGSSSALIAIKTGDTARGYFAASSSATELSAVGASQPLLFTTNGAERMRIDSAGRVGIGTTPSAALEVTSATAFARSVQLHTDSSGGCFVTANTAGTAASGSPPFNQNLFLQTNNTASFVSSIIFRYGTNGSYVEQARIDSGGNLLVGTTTASAKLSVVSSAFNGLFIDAQGAASNALFEKNNTAGGYAVFTFSGSSVGSITTNGTTTSYNVTSDARAKHDIVDAPDAADLIDAIKVRSFKWNADNSEQRYGMIAQELLQVAPEAVSVPADEDQMMGVDYSKLVPMLIKEVQQLRARVAQLEGN